MKRCLFGLLIVGNVLLAMASSAAADEAKDKAIKADRQKIAGQWKIVSMQVNGNMMTDWQASILTLVNSSDGQWSLMCDDKEISAGASTIDPTQEPKTVDFTPNSGLGNGIQYWGIYEIQEDTRTVCFAPVARPRPTDFSSPSGGSNTLVILERVKED